MELCSIARRVPDLEAETARLRRIVKKVSDLEWVDLDLASPPDSPVSDPVSAYCASRVVEHLKFESTQPRSETFWIML